MEEIGRENLERVAKVYDKIRDLFKKKHPEADAVLTQSFQKSVTAIISNLQSKLSESPVSSNQPRLEAEYSLWQMCGDKLTAYIKLIDQPASKVLVEIFAAQQEIIKSCSELRGNAPELELELNSTKKEMEQILAAAEELECTVSKLSAENELLKKENSTVELENEIQLLRAENEGYLQHIIKLSKSKAEVASPITKKKSIKINSNSVKEISLKLLKEIIEDVYVCKEKHDTKLVDGKQPKETMEQYLVYYLNQKYGLKNITNEWYNAIIRAVSSFKEDPEVLLFGKILRHEIEENFKNIFREVKKTTSQLIAMFLKSKNQYLRENDVKNLVNEKLNGNLDEEEWMYIINYMYNPEDCSHLSEIMRIQADKSTVQQMKVSSRSKLKVKSTLPYLEMLRIVLEFQLAGHDQMITPIRNKFKFSDSDSDGILSEMEFGELLANIQCLDRKERLIEELDPYETGKFTFSDVVECFLRETVELHGQRVSVIYMLYLNESSK